MKHSPVAMMLPRRSRTIKLPRVLLRAPQRLAHLNQVPSPLRPNQALSQPPRSRVRPLLVQERLLRLSLAKAHQSQVKPQLSPVQSRRHQSLVRQHRSLALSPLRLSPVKAHQSQARLLARSRASARPQATPCLARCLSQVAPAA